MSAAGFIALRRPSCWKLHPPHVQRLVDPRAACARIGLRARRELRRRVARRPRSASVGARSDRRARADAGQGPTLAPIVNGWQMITETIGVYGNAYLRRAVVAMVGLGANQPEDAVYPLLLADADGRPLDGGERLRAPLRGRRAAAGGGVLVGDDVRPGRLPGRQRINRFAIGDRDASRSRPTDRSTCTCSMRARAARRSESWLPAPRGPLGVTMRLYAPEPQVLDGRWVPPAVRRV